MKKQLHSATTTTALTLLLWLIIRWIVFLFLVIPVTIFTTFTSIVQQKNSKGDDARMTTNSKKYDRIVAVTGGRSPFTLDLIRLLSKAGCQVHCIESSFMFPFALSHFSNHVFKSHFIDAFPNKQPEKFARELGKLCALNHVNLLIPTCEEVMWVSKYKSVIEDEFNKYKSNSSESSFSVFVEQFPIMKSLHDKYQFNQMLKKQVSSSNVEEINVPDSVLLCDTHELREYLKSLSVLTEVSNDLERYDIVLKPAFSRFASQVIIRPTKQMIRSKFGQSTIDSHQVSILEGGPWVAQQFIDGQLLCSYSIVQQGRVTAQVVYIGGEYTNSGRVDGGSVYFENANDPPDVRRFVETFVGGIGYTGQISFDFIRCYKTNRLYPIECNPRSTSGIHLFRSVDPSQFASCFFANEQHGAVLSPMDNNSQIAAAMILLLLFIKPMKSKEEIIRWFDKYLSARDIIFDRSDMLPVITQFLSLIDPVYKILRYRVGFTHAFTHDIEFNSD